MLPCDKGPGPFSDPRFQVAKGKRLPPGEAQLNPRLLAREPRPDLLLKPDGILYNGVESNGVSSFLPQMAFPDSI
jgi:hypothetical protein